MESTRIQQLASVIKDRVKTIDHILAEKGQASPSFRPDASTEYLASVAEDRDALLDALLELHDLFLSPMELLFHHGAHNNLVCIHAIVRFEIAQMFEPGQTITYMQVAEKVEINERLIRRLLKHASTMHIFDCSEGDLIRHTAASAQLRRPEVHDWMSVACTEMWPSATRVVDAITKWPGSDEPTETGFALARGDGDSIYSRIMGDPLKAKKFQGAMAAYASQPGMAVAHLTDHYDWSQFDSGHVVDIGGGRGHVAIPLARKYPSLRITVQDIPPAVAGAENEVPADVGGRVAFQAHDMFQPQPEETAANCFFLRWVLHNWADSYAGKVLKALVPALRPGSKVLIQDIVVSEDRGPTSVLWSEKQIRAADINMLGVFNSYERTRSDWIALLAAADPRFMLVDIVQPRSSTLALLEITWNGGD